MALKLESVHRRSVTPSHMDNLSAANIHTIAKAQIVFLLSTLTEESFGRHQMEIRSLSEHHGVDTYIHLFRRLIVHSQSRLLPKPPISSFDSSISLTFRLLVQETQRLARDPFLADRFGKAVGEGEGDNFRQFNLARFVDRIGLRPLERLVLAASAIGNRTGEQLFDQAVALVRAEFNNAVLELCQSPSLEYADFNPDQLTKLVSDLLSSGPQDAPILDSQQRQALIAAAQSKLGKTASFQPSAHMFEQAHDIVISGGQFYNAADSMTINNSQVIDASAHATHLWQHNAYNAYNQVVLHAPIGKRPSFQIDKKEAERGSLDVDEDGTSNTGEETENDRTHIVPSSLEVKYPQPVIGYLSELVKFEPEPQYEQAMQDGIITFPTPSSTDESPTDTVVHGILSRYPPPPIGDPSSFERIVKALLFSFSPLPPSMIAALFNLDNAQHVRRILLPAYPLVFVPKSPETQEYDDLIPVRFIHPSIAEFFLDRTCSGKYFVDAPTAHRVLLDGSTSVMRRVHKTGQALDNMGRGWRDAYEYACRNWEAHRRAATRSKL